MATKYGVFSETGGPKPAADRWWSSTVTLLRALPAGVLGPGADYLKEDKKKVRQDAAAASEKAGFKSGQAPRTGKVCAAPELSALQGTAAGAHH